MTSERKICKHDSLRLRDGPGLQKPWQVDNKATEDPSVEITSRRQSQWQRHLIHLEQNSHQPQGVWKSPTEYRPGTIALWEICCQQKLNEHSHLKESHQNEAPLCTGKGDPARRKGWFSHHIRCRYGVIRNFRNISCRYLQRHQLMHHQYQVCSKFAQRHSAGSVNQRRLWVELKMEEQNDVFELCLSATFLCCTHLIIYLLCSCQRLNWICAK